MTPNDPTPVVPGGQAFAQALAALGDVTVDSAPPPEATVAPDAGPSAAGVETGRYELIREIGKGGMGRVWLALDTHLGREVALKEVLGEAAGARGRMIREAKVTSRLDHPGVVPVYDLVVIRGRPFYTMRYVDGRTLDAAVKAFHDERADWAAFRGLLTAFVGLCETMAYVHERGVIHRDLKPANVMIGKWNQLVVLDWGLAKDLHAADADGPAGPAAEDATQTAAGALMGTPAYMSPEQARGEAAGASSDVYALGAVLYAILTGRPPFVDVNTVSLLKRVGAEAPPSPAAHWPAVPAALAAVGLKALAKDPKGRYKSAGDLGRDVERWLNDQPVKVHSDGLVTRALRAARQNTAAAAGLAVLTAAALIGLLVWVVVVGEKERRARSAEASAKENEGKARVALDRGLHAIAFAQTELGAGSLGMMPGLQPVKKKLLDSAVEAYDDLMTVWGDDGRVRTATAKGYFQAALAARQLGDDNRARTLLAKALASQESLAKAGPDDMAAQVDLGRTYWLDLVLRRRQEPPIPAPERELPRTLEFLGRLRERATPPELGEVLRLEGLALVMAAQWACEGKDLNGGVARFKAGRVALERAIAVEENPIDSQLALAVACVTAAMHFQAAKPDELKLESVAAALQAVDKVEVRYRDGVPYLQQLGNALNLSAKVKTQVGDFDGALDAATRAVKTRERLTRENPAVPDFQRELASALTNLIAVHVARKQPEALLDPCQRAAEMYRDMPKANRAQARDDREMMFGLLGQLLVALRELKRDAEVARVVMRFHRLGHKGAKMGLSLHDHGLTLVWLAEKEPDATKRDGFVAEATDMFLAASEHGWKDWAEVAKDRPRAVLTAHPRGRGFLATVGVKP